MISERRSLSQLRMLGKRIQDRLRDFASVRALQPLIDMTRSGNAPRLVGADKAGTVFHASGDRCAIGKQDGRALRFDFGAVTAKRFQVHCPISC